MSESTISAVAALLHLNALSARDYKRLAREGGHAVDEDEVKRVCLRIRTAWDKERASLRAEVERLRAKGEALAKATERVTHEWSMDANVRVIGAAVIDARAALAEWES